jgi:hypothetical protein
MIADAPSCESCPARNARPKRQSRETVESESPSASAVSSMERPPKIRASTTFEERGSAASSARSASSISSRSTPTFGSTARSAIMSEPTFAPLPRFFERRRRAWSTRIERIAVAAYASRWDSLWKSLPCRSAMRRNASLTTAVGWSVCDALSRLIMADASARN